MSSDRRQTPRLPYFAEVRVVGRNETYFHPTSNLSTGGAFLRTEFPLPIGTKVRIDLQQARGRPPFEVKGVIAWRQEAAKPGTPEALAQPPIEAGMGVAFVGLGEAEQAQLRELIATITRDGMGG
jgi:uncharacterized protein (TIGR02266 family)